MTRRLLAALLLLVPFAVLLVWLGGGPTDSGRADPATEDDFAAAAGRERPLPAAADPTSAAVLSRTVAPEATTAPAPSGLLLRVFDADGAPAQRARIAWMDLTPPERMIGYYETDVSGELEIPDWREDQRGKRALVLALAEHAPLHRVVEPVDGTLELRLAQDLAIAGQLRVDGELPGVLGTVTAAGFRDTAQAMPAYAREILSQWGLGDGTARCEHDVEGRFQMRGLPAGEVVELTFPEGTVLRGDPARAHPARMTVVTPALDLQVELTRLPAIRGRLIRALEPASIERDASGQFVISAMPSSWLHLEWILHVGEAREEGRTAVLVGQEFRIPLPWPELAGAELRVRDVDGRLLGWREVPGPIGADVDLGDWIVPDAGRSITLTVRDGRGEPLEGAIAVAHQAVQGRTGPDGAVRLEFHAPVGTLTVGAFGHRLVRVPVPEPPPDRMDLRLEPASRLRLEVREPDGAPAQGVVAVLSYSGEFPPDSPEALPGLDVVRGPPSGGGMWSQNWREHHYPLPLDGRAEWSDLPQDAPFTLQVRDGYDFVVYEEELRLGPVEERLVEVTTARSRQEVRGRIVDSDGQPIVGASAMLGGWFSDVRTGVDGRFSFSNSYDPAPSLLLFADGFVSRSVESGAYAPDQDWILEPSRTVWIECRDARGVRADVGLGPLIEMDDGWRGAGVRRGPGLYEVNGVPKRAGRVTVPETEIRPVPLDATQTEVLLDADAP